MRSFKLPLSKEVSFTVEATGHATFKSRDGKEIFHLTPDEFVELFELLCDNRVMLEREIAELENEK